MKDMQHLLTLLREWDIKVFKFINGTLHNELLAAAMKWTANDVFLIIVVLGLFVFLWRSGEKKEKVNTAFALWTLITVNIASNIFLKPFFKRGRPPVELEKVNILFTMKKYSYAFPSTHTAMAVALAVILWDDYKPLRPALVLFVCCVGFFCVYTGGHYPGDVVGGFLLGWVFGKTAQLIKNKSYKR